MQTAAGPRESVNRVLIIVGDATETVDTLYPYYRLQEDDLVPVVAAPTTTTAVMWVNGSN
jgi:putative intracellular protease/amidase